MRAKALPRGELRGVHVLWSILAFFALVIAVNVVFIVYALRTFPGEDVRRSYLQGIHYNDTLAERRAQAALGWRAGATLTPSATGADLVVRMRARDGAALDGLRLTGALQRPATDKGDVALAFERRGDGAYVAHVRGLAPGQWRLRARAEDDRRHALDFERSFTWRAPR